MQVFHTIAPVFDQNSKILILGSFPSVKSRENGFFYGHPQNRFWKILSALFEDDLPQTNDEKRAFLLRHRVALWDVIASCEIRGSSDQSIKNAVPNDLSVILKEANIQHIFTNGGTATRLYRQYLEKQIGIEAIPLPSGSPANAAWSLDALVDAWRVIKADL
jgi:hypoxanthine-DNA glycosylase